MLICGLSICGFKKYACTKEGCNHTKIVTFSCNGRFCPTCGKRATDQWINKQLSILPDCPFQHITFTMPGSLWGLFKDKFELLNKVSKLAAECITTIAKRKGITVGIFTALHTFGHDLKYNVHVHLSVTMGGLDKKDKWKKIRFSKKALMPMWRYRIISILRDAKKDGLIEVDSKLLEDEYNKHWYVHLSKITENAKHSVSYLGGYIKRPPIAMSKLEHYDGKEVQFRYIDRNDNKHKNITYDSDTFIEKLTQHIPEKGFRLIRYYGFLANRLRKSMLTVVQRIFGTIKDENQQIFWRTLFQRSFGTDPLQCILCQSNMAWVATEFGKNAKKLTNYHKEIATSRIMMTPL